MLASGAVQAHPWPLKLVAATEVIGGGWGLVRLGQRFWHASLSNSAVLVIVILSILFVILLVAGLLLWLNRPAGSVLSLIIQAAQLPHVVSAPFGFLFGAPISLIAGFAFTGSPKLSAIWHPSIAFALDSDPEVSWVGINLVAIVLILLVVQTHRQVRARSHG